MSKIGTLILHCAAFASMAGCAIDAASADTGDDQLQADETETAATAPDFAPHSIGPGWHPIRLTNTQLCIQPQGGSPAAGVPLELTTCNYTATAQNWGFLSNPDGSKSMINAAGAQCLYNAGSSPPVNGSGPVIANGCTLSSGSGTPSNAEWQFSSLVNVTTITTLIGHKNLGYCLDVPGGNAFVGATLQIYKCNNTGAQQWTVGVD